MRPWRNSNANRADATKPRRSSEPLDLFQRSAGARHFIWPRRPAVAPIAIAFYGRKTAYNRR